jgi:adenine/guanine phosphoribosyltransferase-like PRPP-binding protein
MHETNGKLAARDLALEALVWTLQDERRAERMLSLTGLTPDGLRAGINERATQAAVLSFLEAHQPDLIACAEAIGVSPAALIAAQRELDV